MERKEAVALLKEIVTNNLAQPSFASIEKNKRGTFSLIIKNEYDLQALKQFITEKNLALKENTEEGYFVIYKP